MTNDGTWNQKVNSMIISLVITSLWMLMLSASPSVQAQTPSAQVSLGCSPGAVHLNSYPGAENSSKNVTCIMENPTSYEEKIELTGTADGLPLEFVEGQIFVIPPGESRDVNVTVSSTEGAHNSVRALTITAEVTEMNGIPPANAATDSVNILVTINPFDSYVAAYDSPLSFTVVLSNQSQNSLDSIRLTNNGNYDATISANLEALSDVLGTHNLSISNPVVWNVIAVDGNSTIQLGVAITENATLNTSSWETLQNGSKRLNLSSSIGFESQLENSTCYQCTQMLDVTLEIFVVEPLIDDENNDEETVVTESSEVPFVGFLATLSVFMLAVVFINNEQEVL
ncbi:MAG: choice-of-anchor T family protein [Candidatus Thermoplasmatota archaeon]|nr:choice-of-anchor T family protein [Candidatus Thermoplasmatota archaeon]